MNVECIPTLGPRISDTAGPSLTKAVADALGIIKNTKNSLTILINDPQRHTDSASVIREIQQQGNFSKTRILIATGTHHFDPDIRSDFQQRVLKGFRYDEVKWHDCTSTQLQKIGNWTVHPWLLDGMDNGDELFVIGSVEPHYFAGFTGGHKTCTVGCAGYKSIEANHANALSPDSQPGRLDGNPVHESIVEMFSHLHEKRKAAAVNLVQVGEKIVGAFGGEVIQSLVSASELARKCFIQHIDAPLDAIILDESGPLGESFYQADKCIKNNEWAVRNGGTIILNAPCRCGVGQNHFLTLLTQAQTYRDALKVIKNRGYSLGDHKAAKLRYLTDPTTRNVKLFIVSDFLSDADAELLGIKKVLTIENALENAKITPEKHNILRLTDAGNMILQVQT